MFDFLPSRQPLFFITRVLGLTAALLTASSLYLARALAETTLAVGDRLTSLAELATLPDGQHQLCSEPEPTESLGEGICYWFSKTGNQLIGYYGIPHSDVFIDCVSGQILNEKIVGEAIAVSWDDVPFPKASRNKPLTWKTLKLGRGTVEYESSDRSGEITLIRFNEAELTLRDFYRYSPAKVKLMSRPPASCSVQEWLNQVATL